jgi:hypothetical protein
LDIQRLLQNLKNIKVRCWDCKFFRLDDEEKPFCIFEDRCDIESYLALKPILKLPYFEFKEDL